MPETPSISDSLREYVPALFRHWQALIVGFAFSFALAVVPALLGKAVPPWLWGLALGLAIVPASFLAWRDKHGRVEQLEAEYRDRKRAQEAKDINVPRAYRRGTLARAALVAQAQTPLGLDPESNAALDLFIGKAIANLDRDCLYIIKREMLAETFGPFEGQRGKYGRLPWEDARAEVKKLELHGLIERVTAEAGPVRFRWTPFGYAVIGKLGPKLQGL
jgi:hypothetical protein